MNLSIIENNGETIYFTDGNELGVYYGVSVDLNAESLNEYDAYHNASAMNCVDAHSVSFRENLITKLRELLEK